MVLNMLPPRKYYNLFLVSKFSTVLNYRSLNADQRNDNFVKDFVILNRH